MLARRIHIDVETYRTRNARTLARLTKEAAERRPSSNTAKAEKERWDTAEAINARASKVINDTAKDPLHAEVLVIACVLAGDVPRKACFDAMEQDERDGLVQFVEFCNMWAGPDTIWSAFNGKRFDFAVLLNRMIRHRIKPPDDFPVWSGYGWRGRVFDTMDKLPTYEPFTSFQEACESYGIECKSTEWNGEPMTGKRVGEAFDRGEFTLIRDYCMQDAIDEESLYLAMTHGDTWGTFDAGDDLAARLAEIDSDDEATPGQKWSAARPFLRAARLI